MAEFEVTVSCGDDPAKVANQIKEVLAKTRRVIEPGDVLALDEKGRLVPAAPALAPRDDNYGEHPNCRCLVVESTDHQHGRAAHRRLLFQGALARVRPISEEDIREARAFDRELAKRMERVNAAREDLIAYARDRLERDQ